MTVDFTDQSSSIDEITSWSWDFGDGGTSNEQNPSHTYQNVGDFTVSLTVRGPGGSDTETKVGYIQVKSSNVSYKYDELNRLSQVTYDDGTTITYTYDEAGNRLTKQVSGAPSKPMPWLPLLLDDE